MKERLNDLRSKEVINVSDGARLGYVCDLIIDTQTALLTGLVIYGKPRLFGLLGKGADRVIPWEDVKTIGDETILVRFVPPPEKGKQGGLLTRILREK